MLRRQLLEKLNSSSDDELLCYDREELQSLLTSKFDASAYRAKQVFEWLYRRRIKDFSEATNLSQDFRDKLASEFRISYPEKAKVAVSSDGTRKYLIKFPDGKEVESVLIAQKHRFTLCVSSQVGCAIGCKFCRTATLGLKRNLTTGEILGQVLAVQDDVAERGADENFKNIVFMGMGEPFHNFDNVTRAIRVLNDPHGLGFSPRKITVSTSGLVPAINKFAEDKAEASLAISLNATDDVTRTKLIPINKKWPLPVLLETLKNYPLGKRKKITIEYVMLGGVNDTKTDLNRLPGLLENIPCKVNLIPYNENAGLGFKAPTEKWVDFWGKSLLNKGLNVTVRWSKGVDIDAACGQLAAKEE